MHVYFDFKYNVKVALTTFVKHGLTIVAVRFHLALSLCVKNARFFCSVVPTGSSSWFSQCLGNPRKEWAWRHTDIS